MAALFEISLPAPAVKHEASYDINILELKKQLPLAIGKRLEKAQQSVLASMAPLEKTDQDLLREMQSVIDKQLHSIERYLNESQINQETLRQVIETTLENGKTELKALQNAFLSNLQQRQTIVQNAMFNSYNSLLCELAKHTGLPANEIASAIQKNIWPAAHKVLQQMRADNPRQFTDRLGETQFEAISLLYGAMSALLKEEVTIASKASPLC